MLMLKKALLISKKQKLTNIVRGFLIENINTDVDELNFKNWDVILLDITELSSFKLNFLTKIKTINPQAILITLTETDANEVIIELIHEKDKSTTFQEGETSELASEIQLHIQKQLSNKSETPKRISIAFLGVQNAGKLLAIRDGESR